MVIAEGDHDDHIAVLIEGSAEAAEPSLVGAPVYSSGMAGRGWLPVVAWFCRWGVVSWACASKT
jgi:hypothetical protein